ncbi:Hypothetical predicted protein, partial [Mytilus galloprovincialis]
LTTDYIAGSTTLAAGTYERIILLPTASTFNFDSLCADKSTAAERTHVAIKDGTEDSAAITCPTSIHGTFSYSDTTCTSTFLDVCSTLTQFYFNYTVCADEQIFSAVGQLLCVFTSTSGNNNYLTLYNKDASPTYQYACLVYSTSDTIVSASINPKECFDSTLQTPTSTVHPDGVTRTFTNYGDYPSSSPTSTNLLWLYILIAIIIILIIIAIIILICYLKRKKKRKEQKKADEESLHPSESEEDEKRNDEEQKRDEKKREEQKRKPSPIPMKDEDRTSIDSGIQQDKKEEEKAKKVVIEDKREDKEEIKVKEQEDEQKEDVDDEAENSGSEGTASSSRVTTPDPEEIERNIRKIGMKKSTDFKPQGDLSKVLVTRKMEEQKRKEKDHGKWTKMKNIFRVKAKKIKVASYQNNDNKDNKREDGRNSDSDDERLHREKTIAPFMKEYHYKKQMDHVLDEQHVREGKPDFKDRIKDSDDDDEEFGGIIDDEKKRREHEKIEQTRIEQLNEKNKHEGKKPLQSSKNAGEKRHTKGSEHMRKKQINGDQGKEMDELERAKRKQRTEDQGKDSGVDSPDFKKETSFIENNEEMEAVEMTEPPPGYIRDSTGQIIRLYDGKVMTQEEMQSIFPTARLGMLFHVPRLKRTSHGRPTGEYIEDPFGPKLENDRESIRNVELKEEHSKPKHPRSSKGSARRDIKEKTVAFDMDDGKSMNSDILMVEDEDEWKHRRDSSTTNRELLRKRLFKNKRKSRSHGGADNKMFMSDDGRPRELSDLVRVIPQNSANKYLLNGRAPIPGSVVSRNDSMKNKFDHEQQQMYREGLATDKKILERSPSLKRPPGVPRQAFTEQDPDDIRVSIDNEENENRLQRQENGINIGSDDEFFLVGDNGEQQPEQFFTHTRLPGQTTVRPLPGSHDMFCHKHDMRHALPWSLINQYQIRESSLLDINSVSKHHTMSKSAGNVKRDMDDRRLRELLEELYKDKKYFDHVIDTTEPNTEPIIDERDLAEHGRGFLLDRAEYWDGRGVHIPRPPTTALGLRLSRMNTNMLDSGRVSNISYASTVTPPPHPEQRQETPKQPKEAFVKREHTVC